MKWKIMSKQEDGPLFYDDFENFNSSNDREESDNPDEDDEDEDDDDVLASNDQILGDWRSFRRKLAANERKATAKSIPDAPNHPSNSSTVTNNGKNSDAATSPQLTTQTMISTKSPRHSKVKSPNEILLAQQNEKLALEYHNDVWAHEIATVRAMDSPASIVIPFLSTHSACPQPEIGGLMVRMPLEVEIRRNYKHSVTGQKLRQRLLQRLARDQPNVSSSSSSSSSTLDTASSAGADRMTVDTMEMSIWYSTAQSLVEEEMKVIAGAAESNGELDSSILTDESNEVLQLYLDHQETWQEVCLVTSYDSTAATTLVLNRPLALQLTDALGKLVLYGAFSGKKSSTLDIPFKDFMKAFGKECGIYVGGPDDQHLPAVLIHGIAHLDGATEIAPGTGIYQGGLKAAVEGVLSGVYKPLEFRFFVGRHSYVPELENDAEFLDTDDDDDEDESDDIVVASSLDLDVVLGKYQPVACARSVALKQCIQLPKPLWHEVLQLCGGELKDISEFEQLKRDDIPFEFVNEDDDDDEDIIDGLQIIALNDDDTIDDDDDDDDDDEYFKI
jgi:Uncharacterized ACR, COG1678